MSNEVLALLDQLKADPSNAQTRRDLRARLAQDRDAFGRAATDATPTARTRPATTASPQGARGQVWKNHSGNQVAEPLQVFEPEGLAELQEIVRRAAAKGLTARAVATGYSVSDIATTTGFLVETLALDRRLAIEPALLEPQVDAAHLVRIEAGVTIAQLNEWLDADGLGLPNQPSASKLTFVGGMLTASHGSGLGTGTLASFVRSLVMVTKGGEICRVEPAQGITNAAAYQAAYPEVTLVQDDDLFYCTLVSFGSLGLIYSVTLEVRDQFWLTETRTVMTWDDLVYQLKSTGGALPALLTDHPYVEMLVNPYPTRGADGKEHTALLTARDEAPKPTVPALLRPHRNWLTELAAAIPISDAVLVGFLDTFPGFAPTALDLAIEGLADAGVVAVSHEILDLGAAATLDAYAIEVAFPWHKAVEAIQVVIDTARVAAEEGDQYHTSPVSLRFVAAEKAFLAPQYDADAEPTCMIEVPMLVGTDGGFDHLRRLQRALYAVGGRPHWGLELDQLTGSADLMKRMYPRWETFAKVFGDYNDHGVFDNATTLRLGLTRDGYTR